MVGWRGRSLRGKRLSRAARAWEHQKLQELGLEDVDWDHGLWCPRCRAALKRRARLQALAQIERMPVDEGQDERAPAPPAPDGAGPRLARRILRRSRRRRRG